MAIEDRKMRLKKPFNNGSPVVFDLQPGGKLLQGYVIVKGNLKITGGTTSGTPIGTSALLNLIQHITVTANRVANGRYPGGKIVDCSPLALLTYAIRQRCGKYFVAQKPAVALTGAAGTFAVYMAIPIYFATPQNWQTALNLDKGTYQGVQVEVDVAESIADLFSGSDRVLDTSGLVVEWDDKRMGLGGDSTPLYQEDHVMQIPSTFDAQVDKAMPSDGAFESMLVIGEQGTGRALSDALLNKVTMVGPALQFDQTAEQIREAMFDEGLYDPATDATGQYCIDFTDGDLRNSNDANGLAINWDINLVSSPFDDQLRIFTRRVYALPPAA